MQTEFDKIVKNNKNIKPSNSIQFGEGEQKESKLHIHYFDDNENIKDIFGQNVNVDITYNKNSGEILVCVQQPHNDKWFNTAIKSSRKMTFRPSE